MYKKIFKPTFDYLVSIIGIIILSPIFILIIIILSFSNNGKPFFVQSRPGKNEKIFKLIKFKTMNDKKDIDGNLLSDAERLTKFGKFVRNGSLDELPQLLNVIIGDMSIIGPRPLLKQYLPLYNEIQKQRHQVKPGITGWAQINGRNAISWEQKFEYDVFYIQNLSFWLDLKIIFSTILKVFKKEGINASNTTTMEVFIGNK